MAPHPLVLASSSPRRIELLRQIGIEPDRILPPHIDETPGPRELPRNHALRMAGQKALAASAAAQMPAFVLAADTVVATGRTILPKTESEEAARLCLERLSGRRHRVYGGIAVLTPARKLVTRISMTMVKMKALSGDELSWYLASGEWRGKAGGYAIQGKAARFVTAINGSYTNVVGLSVSDVAMMLDGLGWRPCGPGPR